MRQDSASDVHQVEFRCFGYTSTTSYEYVNGEFVYHDSTIEMFECDWLDSRASSP